MKELIPLSKLKARRAFLAIELNKAYQNNPEQFKECARPMMHRDNYLRLGEEIIVDRLYEWLVHKADSQDWAVILVVMGYATFPAVNIKYYGGSMLL